MKVLVYGGWFGSRNLGDEAILIGVRELFSKSLPEADLTALSLDPEYTKKTCGVNAEKIQSPKSVLFNKTKYLELFKNAEACIVTGGTPFYDYGHLSRIIHIGLPALTKKKVVCFGVGSKPITTVKGREITRVLLLNTSRISTRDYVSKKIITRFTKNPITVTGDTGLFLNPYIRKTRNHDTVLICPRCLSTDHQRHYHQEINQSRISRIRHSIAITADKLMNLGYEVTFIPFHTHAPDDDREEIRIITNLMKNKDPEIISRPPTPVDALTQICQSAHVIGLRLHSLVLAASAGVSYTSINYDLKIQGFMELMNVDTQLSTIDEGLHGLSNRTLETLENPEQFTAQTRGRVEKIRRGIKTEANTVSETIREQVKDS